MKTVWIIGAGASKSHSNDKFPLINEFFSYAKEKNIIAENTKTLKKEYEEVGEYIYENFGKKILKKTDKIDIEQILTNLEIDILKFPNKNLKPIRNKIINLIRKLLILQSEEIDQPEGNYDFFKTRQNDTLLTFNWDILLDNILDRINILNNSTGTKYEDGSNQYYNSVYDLSAFGETTFYRLVIEKPYSKYKDDKGYYLKMHGSIDWVYCTNSSCRGYHKVFPVQDIKSDYYCSECNELTEYLIIPPVLNKQYDMYPMIKRIWNKSVKEINIAEEIIIWGYSLPPTDFFSNWLLRQSSNLKKVTIINPSLIKISKQSEYSKITWNTNFKKPFLDIFKHKIDINEIEYYEIFHDYKQKQNLNNKYKFNEFYIIN